MMDRESVRNVEFHSKDTFEKLVYVVGFIIRNLVDYSLKNVSMCVLCKILSIAVVRGIDVMPHSVVRLLVDRGEQSDS